MKEIGTGETTTSRRTCVKGVAAVGTGVATATYVKTPPGSPGNAVIAGHFDSTTGPAVFYHLSDLKPGDELITSTEDGQEHHFIVTEIAV